MTPRRVAVVEVVLALALVAGAFWCWHLGLRTSDFPPYTKDVAVQPITYYSPPWLAGAVGAVVVAALLTVDAVRRRRAEIRVPGSAASVVGR